MSNHLKKSHTIYKKINNMRHISTFYEQWNKLPYKRVL